MTIAPPLPYSLDAERALLGAILVDNAKLEMAQELQPVDFFDTRHRVIFSMIRSLRERGRGADLLIVVSALEDAHQLDTAGGADYVASLLDGVPRVIAAGEWARIVAEKAHLRRIAHAAELARDAALAGDTETALRAIATAASTGRSGARTPWDSAEPLGDFLSSSWEGADFLDAERRIIARGSVTEIFSPRGLGKSLLALSLAIQLSQQGYRVLFLDRDNPRHVLRSRLEGFGANGDTPGLRVLSREKCPPLTNTAAWASFPYAEYDAVILDSLDSAAEGIGEQDSSKPSRAIAPLLDISRRENGPAVLVLGNTVRAGTHSRGSGVVEDRADVVYEVRDATGFSPTGSKPWHEELPPADAGSWASRSSRRKQKEIFRLGFIASKFRVGIEPEPFALEIDVTVEPWSVRDVTDELDRGGAAARHERAKAKAESFAKAGDALAAEIVRRAAAGQPAMLKDRDAVPFLTAMGLKRAEARDLLKRPDGRWVIAPLKGHKGSPWAVLPSEKSEVGGGNTSLTESAQTLGIEDDNFRRVHAVRTAKTRPSEPPYLSGLQRPTISAEQLSSTAPANPETKSHADGPITREALRLATDPAARAVRKLLRAGDYIDERGRIGRIQ